MGVGEIDGERSRNNPFSSQVDNCREASGLERGTRSVQGEASEEWNPTNGSSMKQGCRLEFAKTAERLRKPESGTEVGLEQPAS